MAVAMLLGGCSSALITDHLPTAAGGLPENAPARSATPIAYPAVHDVPPSRADNMLSAADQKRLEDDLIAARARTNGNVEATGSTGNPGAGTNRAP